MSQAGKLRPSWKSLRAKLPCS